MSERIKTIFVVGPTASGKTSLSIELAKKFNGEIIFNQTNFLEVVNFSNSKFKYNTTFDNVIFKTPSTSVFTKCLDLSHGFSPSESVMSSTPTDS